MNRKAVITDLDGTLALLNDRDPYQEQHLLMDDEVNIELQRILKFYEKQGVAIIVATGRWEDKIDLTKKWLESKADINATEIFMRPMVNYDNARILKEWYLENVIFQRYDPFLAFEDLFAIAQMYRKHDIPCWQVNVDPFLKEKDGVV